ncbi:Crp/Fnr family transcriptional regulator [Paenibacillus sp. 1001270B_150601_E10]|uniref:Crp/Fnr family transcriptional regulator n=1 Tax=Paenibacillus sp. 1001270B_150601_E10 TaxID=2787079 RepID=UPI00189C8475|nr:Crp/Fnr family transcriptional regulator [Paenibacillus sp. 1001270B_150601_E10]
MIQLLKRVPLFSELSDEQMDIVTSITSQLEFEPNTVLFERGDPGSAFCIVMKGSVKVYTSNEEGHQKILAVFHPGDSFGELSLIDGKPRSATVETLEDTVLITITNESFHLLLRAHYDIAQKVMIQLCSRLRATNTHVYDLTFLEPSARIIKNMIRNAKLHGERLEDKLIVRSAFSREATAGLAGVKLHILDEVLHELQSESILSIASDHYSIDLAKLYESPYIL